MKALTGIGRRRTFPLADGGLQPPFCSAVFRLAAFLQQRKEPLVAHYRVNAGYIPLNHWVHDPIQGGGRIIGEGCHFVDFLTFLVGQAPDLCNRICAAGWQAVTRKTMQSSPSPYPDGSLGTVSYLANGDKAFPKERVEVFAGGRVAVLDDFRSLEMIGEWETNALKLSDCARTKVTGRNGKLLRKPSPQEVRRPSPIITCSELRGQPSQRLRRCVTAETVMISSGE